MFAHGQDWRRPTRETRARYMTTDARKLVETLAYNSQYTIESVTP